MPETWISLGKYYVIRHRMWPDGRYAYEAIGLTADWPFITKQNKGLPTYLA